MHSMPTSEQKSSDITEQNVENNNNTKRNGEKNTFLTAQRESRSSEISLNNNSNSNEKTETLDIKWDGTTLL